MKCNDVHKDFECLYLTLLSDKLCKIQDSVGSKKTSKNTKPTKLWAEDMPQSQSRRSWLGGPVVALICGAWGDSKSNNAFLRKLLKCCHDSRTILDPRPCGGIFISELIFTALFGLQIVKRLLNLSVSDICLWVKEQFSALNMNID